MNTRYDRILFFDELPPDEQEAVRAQLSDDPELAETAAAWQAVRAAARDRLDADLPDRELLVLYALAEEGQDHHLSGAEQEALAAARPAIKQALAAHPALRDVVERVQTERAAFEAAWADHAAARSAATAPAQRSDRVPRTPDAHRTTGRWAFRLGVGTALIVLAVTVLFMLPRGGEEVTVTVAEGAPLRTVTFADGSTARLTEGTRLTYTPAEEKSPFNRAVALETGRAFFDVVTKPATFVVETPTARTAVLGTRFGVQASAEETSVVLATGRLAVATRSDTTRQVVLEPGQASRVRQSEAPTPPTAVDLNEALGWAGYFIFRNTPLAEAAQQLARHYEVTIAVDEALRDEAVTGTFERDQEIETILNVLGRTLNATVRAESAGAYRLVPAERP